MSTIYYDIECDFTQIPNHIILNPKISGTAKAIYFYIVMRIRQNKDWEFYDYDIMSYLKEGRDSFRNAKKELIKSGYLVKIKQNIAESGKYKGCEYAIKKEPITENPTSAKPKTAEPTSVTPYTNNNKQSNNINKKQSNQDISTTSGFSQSENSVCKNSLHTQSNYSEIPNYSTNFNSVELHQIKKSAVKENLTIQKQDGQQNYILNTSKKNVVEKNAEFEAFWNEWRAMCKAKGSPTGEKKPAEIEYQKAVKIANHQGIMRTLEAFKDFILLAFENNKHACRWLKNIHWPDFENVIADYKQQTEILKTNLKKQGKPLPIAQKTPEKAQEEVKMKEDTQNKLEAIKSRLNTKEKEFNDYIKEYLKECYTNTYDVHYNLWIKNIVIKCREGVATVGVFKDISPQWQKLQPILTRELSSKGFKFEKIEWKLID